MESSQEIVESSQQPVEIPTARRRGRPARSGVPVGTEPRRSKRVRMQPALDLPAVDIGDWQCATNLTIPESNTEEERDIGNVSVSLFDGQKDLLQQYQDHELLQARGENTLDQEVEISRIAYERMRVNTTDVFGEESESRECGPTGAVNDASGTSKQDDYPRVSRKDVEIQCTLQECIRDKESEQGLSKTRECHDVAIQSSPETRIAAVNTNTVERHSENVASQTIPELHRVLEHHSVAVNTEPAPIALVKPVETCDAAVQMYHTVRVQEIGIQTEQANEPIPETPSVSQRNVCIQHNSPNLLDLSMTNMVNLGTRLGLDPLQLRRAILRTMSGQQPGEPVSCSGQQETSYDEQDEPYDVHYGYFREELDEAEADSTQSDMNEYPLGCSGFGGSSQGF